MNAKKTGYALGGFIFLGLGLVGIVLPILPTVPFLLLAAFCFARSSKRLDDWFKQTVVYRQYLQDYSAGKGMTAQAKVRVLAVVTALMGFGIFMMARKGLWIPCGIVGLVWLGHLYYFLFRVPLKRPGEQTDTQPLRSSPQESPSNGGDHP